ncbi:MULTISPECIES: hypothetical protein, partial [unclassified Streptomyces]|uniref:hypothetical protein n=1 Tax=unclassified Streptomyces TaxID=2593676 RepID=UPI00081EAA28
MPDVTVRHGPDSEPEPGRGHAPERPPVAGSRPPYDGALLTALVARLREAGLDPDAEQLCDAIWLAQQTSSGRSGRPSSEDAENAEGDTRAGSDQADSGPLSVTRPGEQDRTGEDGPADEPLP